MKDSDVLDRLKGLSDKELKELFYKIKKRRRASPHKAHNYVPHEKQLNFHADPAKIRLVQGSNRSGKTVSGIMECYWYLSGTHPYFDIKPPVRGRVSTTSFEKGLKQIILPKITEWFPPDEIAQWDKNTQGQISGVYMKNGSYMDFMSYQQSFNKFEGIDLDFWWCDEAPPRDIYYSLLTRIVDRSGRGWITMSPLSEPWIDEEIWEPARAGKKKDVACFEMLMDDNIHLPREMVEFIQDQLPEDEKEARVFGRWSHKLHRILKEFDRAVHVCEPFDIPSHWRFYEVIDPHPAKPHVVVWFAVAPDNMIYAIKEAEWAGTIGALGDFVIKNRPVRRQPDLVIVDTSTVLRAAKMTEQMTPINLQQVLKNKIGEFIQAIKEPEAGIDLLRQRLENTVKFYSEPDENKRDTWNHRGIRFFSTCKTLIRQMENWVYDNYSYTHRISNEDKIKPVKRNDDYVDCARYMATMDPNYQSKWTPMRIEGLHKTLGRKYYNKKRIKNA